MFVRFDIHSILGMDGASSYKQCGFGTACRTDDDRAFPVLEIPQWMFDAAECCRIAVSSGIMVRCEASRHLRALLAEAQQSSWIPGGADAEVVKMARP